MQLLEQDRAYRGCVKVGFEPASPGSSDTEAKINLGFFPSNLPPRGYKPCCLHRYRLYQCIKWHNKLISLTIIAKCAFIPCMDFVHEELENIFVAEIFALKLESTRECFLKVPYVTTHKLQYHNSCQIKSSHLKSLIKLTLLYLCMPPLKYTLLMFLGKIYYYIGNR